MGARLRHLVPAGLMARVPHKRWQVRLPTFDKSILPDMDYPWLRFWRREHAEARLRQLNREDDRPPAYVLVDLLTGEIPPVDPEGPVARREGSLLRLALWPVHAGVIGFTLVLLAGARDSATRLILGVLLVVQAFTLGVTLLRQMMRSGT